jgi:cytochrome c oxidase cbb3-type subunit 2/cytochrome c oxidase cbb3-type subunit I/II
MKMTPALLIIGSLLMFWASMSVMVILPAVTMDEKPSAIWRAMTSEEKAGHNLYIQNGCSYCHSLYIRINDWDVGAERIAQRGDYVGQQPAILGTERTGPDLSQEGGEHPDDWHMAHFVNPRFTIPISLMPNWLFLGEGNLKKLTAYVQYLGMKNADTRTDRQKLWKGAAVKAYNSGPDQNIQWIHDHVPAVWRQMPNPYPATDASILRGKTTYQRFCMGCHGPIGDGNGPAAKYLMPTPLNFTTLRRNITGNRYIGGTFYYQIMNGITGTAMPYFKKDLESEKIWDLSNYIAVSFLGYTDSNTDPRGIDAAYEPEWKNPYKPPQVKGPDTGKPVGEPKN